MALFRTIWSGLKGLFRGRHLNQEMDEELSDYLNSAVEDKVRRGMSHADAVHSARVEMGSTEAVKQKVWLTRWESMFEEMGGDVRYGLRTLLKSPGFTTVAVVTLALGIGANTAIFSLINAIMLRTLPIIDPQSLVSIKWSARSLPNTGGVGFYNWGSCPDAMPTPDWPITGDHASVHDPVAEGCVFSYPMFEQIKSEQKVFSDVIAMVPSSVPVNAMGHSSRAEGLCVSGNFFSVLGTHPAVGRLLNSSDDNISASPSVVVSYRFWRNSLDSDPTVIGKSILLGKTRYTLVGIAMPEFGELDPGVPLDFWVPLALQPDTAIEANPKALWLGIMARLKPGISVSQAKAAMDTIFMQSSTIGPMAIFKPSDSPRIELPTAAYGLNSLRYNFTRPLFTLLTAVGLVLLIACANIAGLMVARSAARRKEIAMRAALGASRIRIVRQLITESILLCVAGGAAGILLGYSGANALALFLSANWGEPLEINVHPDAHILGFTLMVSVLVGLLLGLAPALNSGKVDLIRALKETVGSATGASHGRWFTLGNGLVVVQMALTVIVLVGAGLLVRTLANLKSVDAGFDPKNLLIFDLDATYSSRVGEQISNLGPELRERLSGLPGVSSVTYSFMAPMKGGRMQADLNSIGPAKLSGTFSWMPVAPDFFKTMRIPLIAGRTITIQDIHDPKSATPDLIAVVNENFARRFFDKQNPVGQYFRVGARKNETQIVGVVGNTRYENLRDASLPMVYVPISNHPLFSGVGAFEIRTIMDPKSMISAVRAAVNSFDGNLLITDLKTQAEQIDQNIYQERLIADLSSLFGLLALLVACVGIYGLLSYQVTRRTPEIGVRLALGAQRGDVLRLVIRQGAILVALGVAIGTGAALSLTRYLQSFLFEVKPADPLTLFGVVLLLGIVALTACFIPARRAASVDPMVALRYE